MFWRYVIGGFNAVIACCELGMQGFEEAAVDPLPVIPAAETLVVEFLDYWFLFVFELIFGTF